MKLGWLGLVAVSALSACTITQSSSSSTGADGGGAGGATSTGSNCLVASACCALAQQQGSADPRNGTANCDGKNLGGEEWCGAAAELAKKALHAEEVQGQCVLGLTPNTVTRVPIVWVNSTSENKVALFDSPSGKEILRVPTWGNFPNRTAVANDGSVWITNRDSYHYVHIGLDGKVLCASDYGQSQQGDDPKKVGYTRAAAIDADGYAWIGFNDTGEIVKLDPRASDGKVTLTDPVDGTTQEAPRCKEVKRLKLTTTMPYGLAADGDGNLWVGILGSGTVAKVDAHNEKILGEYDLTKDPAFPADGCQSFYGMAIDMEGNPWYANMNCGNVLKLDKSTGKILGNYRAPEATPMETPRAIGIDRDGHMWVSDNSTQYVHEFDVNGTWMKRVDIGCVDGDTSPGTLGTGSDIDGDMWTVVQSEGLVSKYKTDGTKIGCYPKVDPNDPEVDKKKLSSPYTYSDLTGSTNSLVTSQLGRWRAVVDAKSAVTWALVSYQATLPEGTSVCIRVRSAAAQAGLEKAAWSTALCGTDKVGPYTVQNLLPGGKPMLDKGEFLEVELQLNSTSKSATPTVTDLSVASLK
jgi:streptogramin lyase